jgi:bifunctional enzyme CysN/CysC/sulfate adenylyltransferase subunit 1
VQAVVTDVINKLNMSTLETESEPGRLAMNDIGQIRLRTAKPLVFDGYATNRLTGSFILIEQGTNSTVAAGMLLPPREVVKPEIGDYVI